MRKWTPLRLLVVTARDHHFARRETGRIRRKDIMAKFVAKEMEQRKLIEKNTVYMKL